MEDFLGTTIRRTVSIPKIADGESILAIVDVGGKLLNKDIIYQKFFEFGAEGVKNYLRDIFVERGGSEENFNKMFSVANSKILNKNKKQSKK